MKLIDRNEVIRKRQALTRAGLKPSFTFHSNFRLKERINLNRPPLVVSTIYRSPLTSQCYFSVFCKGRVAQRSST